MIGSVKRGKGGHPVVFTKNNGHVEEAPDVRYGFVNAFNPISVGSWIRNWCGGFSALDFSYDSEGDIIGFSAVLESGRVLRARCVKAFELERGAVWVESFKTTQR